MSKTPKDSAPAAKPAAPALKTLDVTQKEAAKIKGGKVATVGGAGGASTARNLPP